MKRVVRLICIIGCLLILFTCSVLAEDVSLGGVIIDGSKIISQQLDGKYSITYTELIDTELTSGQQLVLLVVRGVASEIERLAISAENIRYIDQAAATDTQVSFSNFIPSSVPNCTILLGGFTDGPKIIGYIEAAKVTVTGNVTISGKTKAFVKLIDTNQVEYSGESITPTDSQIVSFSVLLVPVGSYTLYVYKAGHTSYTKQNITVNEFGVNLSNIVLYGGDVALTGKGAINVYDLSALLGEFGKPTASSTNTLTDINENGDINVYDLSILLANYGKSNIIE
ncbi:MAG: hypothetical protein LLG09_00705 [Negativicutes bacterium]|nr:hypothetical protein [Negativicutes bacterium]